MVKVVVEVVQFINQANIKMVRLNNYLTLREEENQSRKVKPE
jgi:hypothetical protein